MYTSAEIQSAVEQLVRSSIRRPYETSGVRRSDVTFSDMSDAAAGVFILYPNALFYTAKLATDKLLKVVEANQLLLASFTQYINAVARHVSPVTALNSLANARVALEEIASASSTRASGFKSITETSAYTRFDNNTQRFLSDVSNAVVQDGNVVPTPDEARAQFASIFTEVQDGFIDIVRRASLLAGAAVDFDNMALPATLFESIASNAYNLVKSEYDKLNALTPEERLTVIRTTVLNILATRSTVKGFGSMVSPGMFYTLTGNGGVYASTDYPPVHASLTGDMYGPFPILGTANELDLRLDGATSITTNIKVQPSFVPFIEGTVKEPYVIDMAPDNRFFTLGLKNWPTVGVTTLVEVVLTVATFDAYEVCLEINSAVNVVDPDMPLLAEPYCNPLRYTGNFDISFGAGLTLTAVNPAAVDFVALGVQPGDFVIIRDPTSLADGTIVQIGVVNTSSLDGGVIHGSGIVETNKTCQISNGNLAIRLRITDQTDSAIPKPDYRLQALLDRVAIYIPQVGAGTIEDQFYGSTVLGFVPLMEATARPTPASEVVLTYNAQPGAAVNGVARTMASAVFDPIAYEGPGRTNSYDPTMFVAAKYKAMGDVTGGTTVVFTCAGALAAGVHTGYVVVLRTSSVPADVNAMGVVTAVSDTYINATMGAPITAATGIELEVGLNLGRDDILDAALIVSGDTANDGEYVVRSQGVVPFELTVDRRIPVPYGIGNLPITCTLALGRHLMKFESLKEDLTAQIYMATESNTKSAFFKFFTTEPRNAYGSTAYYKPPSLPKGLGEGDLLELYTTNLTPSYVGTITFIDSSVGVLGLDVALTVTTPSMTFTKDSPVPFARIRRQHTDNYEVLSTAITAWLNSLNLDQNFSDLTRALNALLVNKNPTPTQVKAATVQVTNLNNVLLDLWTILSVYNAPVVEQVDALVKSFLEKGADRAVDVLLECRFSEFFGIGQDASSYASYVQATIKDVQNTDLPIRKFDRLTKNKAKQALQASWDEADFEFTKGDADPEVPYDPPGTADFLIQR